MRTISRSALAVSFCGLALSAAADGSLKSPEVGADGRVTFRSRNPGANEVLLDLEGFPRRPMQRDGEGVWSLTTDALDPDFYGYMFVVDGVNRIDPSNPAIKPNLIAPENVVYVPGPAALPWEAGDVPHGVLHRHVHRSKLVGDRRETYVYTPPGYDQSAKTTYPVLYLLHGFSDDASGWTAVGRADVILDNLIAQGKAKPMLLIMPFGYGAPEMLEGGFGALDEPVVRRRNFDRFREVLLTEVMPEVEASYRITRQRSARAVAGLSMGGGESLIVGLTAPDRFAWIGAFSTFLGDDFAATIPLPPSPDVQPRLLWISCGRDDALAKRSREIGAWLDTKHVTHVQLETPGAHAWQVWRRNLAAFLPLLFR